MKKSIRKKRYWLLSFLFASLFILYSGYAGDTPFQVKGKNRIRVEDQSQFSLPYAIRLFHKAETYLKKGNSYLAWKTYLEIAQKMPNLLIPIEGQTHFESSRLFAWKKMKEILVAELPLAEPPNYIFDRLFETATQDMELSGEERFFIFETIAPYLPTKKGGFWHEKLSDVLFERGDFILALCLLEMVKAFSIYYDYEKGSLRRENANRIDRKMEIIKNIMEGGEGNDMKFTPTLHLKTGAELDGDGGWGRDYLIIEFSDKSVIERQFFDIGAAFFPHFFITSHDYGFLIFDSPSFWVLDINGNFLEKWRISKEIIYSYGLKDVLFSKEGFMSIPKGIFQMGSSESEMGRNSLNEVLHTVTLTKEFEIQKTEVTQLQWVALMGNAPSGFKTYCKEEEYDEKLGICSNYPVESVSWEEVKEFIERLNQIQSKYDYRLPTEAEWEYAARLSGVPEEERKNFLTPNGFLDLRKSDRAKSAYGFGNDPNLLEQYAWYSENSSGQTQPVLNSRKSIGGIYGMHGNVGEWVEDLYDKNYGLTAIELNDELKDPLNNHTGWNHVFRGGSWNYHFSWLFRSAGRHSGGPRYHYDNVGFRLVRARR